MNSMQQMKDPAAGVPRELLPHLHLISKNRYPATNNPSLDSIVGYLLEAPKTVRDGQPVQWQYLDCPQDGTVFITWQPHELGMNFASDGYVWADQEVSFTSEVRGYQLQMFMHKSGFRPQQEPTACHSRRRYRLLPSQQPMNQPMNGPMPDPSLWLIHYSKAAPRDHIPAANVPVTPPVHASLQQRRMIMGAGALARKEFMLHDRANWPTINLPGGLGRHGSGGQLGPNAHRRGQSLTGHEPTIEEEEDVSRGDALDFMTPRDISRMRYEQHHEWMEEILESPYRTMQIVPPELGLGRKGELESLTRDFFVAPTGTSQESSADGQMARVGRLDPGKAEEFTKMANKKLADMQLELQKMKQAHQKRMEKLRKVTALSAAEKKLRSAHSEFGQRKSVVNGTISTGTAGVDPIDEIVKDVEETTGRKIDRVKNVTRIAKGGYQEMQINATAPAEQTPSSAIPSKATPSVPPPEPQQPVQAQQSQQQPSQAGNDEQNQNGVPLPDSNSNTSAQPASEISQTQGADKEESPSADQNGAGDVDVDIDMAELDNQEPQPDGLGDANDWVMVDDNNTGDNLDPSSFDDLTNVVDQGDQDEDQTPINTGFTPVESANQTPQPPGQQQQAQDPEHQLTGQTPLDTGDFDFGDVNTAGDALADYGADDDDDDLNLDTMDDSAFGDAFHPPDDNDLS